MKRFLSIVLFTMIFANPTLAEDAPTTTTGGGPGLTVQSAKGSGTLKDTTSHTTLGNGVVVSTSTGRMANRTAVPVAVAAVRRVDPLAQQ